MPGKSLSVKLVNEMIRMTNNHPDYLQQLCHNVWNSTASEASEETLTGSIDVVIRSNALHYQDICESLSNTQLNLLHAILAGETKLTATKVMQQFRLGTPRNVSKNKRVLMEKDIVEIHGENIFFNDPIFEYWMRK